MAAPLIHTILVLLVHYSIPPFCTLDFITSTSFLPNSVRPLGCVHNTCFPCDARSDTRSNSKQALNPFRSSFSNYQFANWLCCTMGILEPGPVHIAPASSARIGGLNTFFHQSAYCICKGISLIGSLFDHSQFNQII